MGDKPNKAKGGNDRIGKGGVIAAIADTLNPRQCHVVALPKPSDRERTQWYSQRYVAQLPAAGEIALFDRSGYNRAGVEKVMGFCTPAQTDAFLAPVPQFEKMLVDERLEDPKKRWKLSPIELKAREKYAEYGAARDAMLAATHNKRAVDTGELQ